MSARQDSRRRAAAWLVACAASLSPATARAADPDRPTPFADAVSTPPRWTVGIVLERGVHAIVGKALVDDQLLGLSVTRWLGSRFGVNTRLLLSPNTEALVDTRALLATGMRVRSRILGVETFLGAGAHAEVRLRNHYWLTYVTPGEIGATLWQRGSFRIELYTGLRAVVAGELVNHFLIDPNGVDNEDATDRLRAEKRRPWEGFVSLVIGRAL